MHTPEPSECSDALVISGPILWVIRPRTCLRPWWPSRRHWQPVYQLDRYVYRLTAKDLSLRLPQILYYTLALMALSYAVHVPDVQPIDDKQDTLEDLRPGAGESSDFAILTFALVKWAMDSVLYVLSGGVAAGHGIHNFVRCSVLGLLQQCTTVLGFAGSIMAFCGLGFAIDFRPWRPGMKGLHQEFMLKACRRAGMQYCEAKYGR